MAFIDAADFNAPAPRGLPGAFASQAQANNRVGPTNPLAYRATQNPVWQYTEDKIDASRWNKAFPYQFLVLDYVKEGGFYRKDPDWEFTLPIPPESLSIGMPFAIEARATMGGIAEEHNGIVFRPITFSGTMGVLPNRESAFQAAGNNGIADISSLTGGLFVGTAQNIASTVSNIADAVGARKFNLMDEAALSSDATTMPGRGTGYYQFRLLEMFLQNYAELKTRPEGKYKRLALAIWKDQSVWLVTPADFQLRRNAGEALSYSYSFSGKATARVKVQGVLPRALDHFRSQPRDLSVLATVLETLAIARETLAGVKNTLEAIRGDINLALFEPMRETALLCKDALGVSATLADLPGNIAQDAKGAVFALAVASGSLAWSISEANAALTDATTVNATARAPSSISHAQNAGADPLNKLFDDPAASYEIFSKIDTKKLDLTPATQKKIAAEVDRVRNLSRLDFERMRDQIQGVAADFADAIGESHPTFSETFNRATITGSKVATDEDFELLFTLNETVMAFDKMAVAGSFELGRLAAIQYIAGLARGAGIAFTEPVSKFAVPFPYGSTLEMVAARYLGDPNRWHEIAALNGLQAPYVDEEGFELPLLVKGFENQVVVEDSTKLFVGQPVTISASNTSRTARRIMRLEVLSSTMTVVHLDGDADLDRYTPTGSGLLHAFLPDTVNSGQQIFIPSTQSLPEEAMSSKSIPGIDSFRTLLEAGGVDLMLTSGGDLAVTPDGDCKLAVGLTNLVQRVRIAITTPRGSLPQHPGFGLAIAVGQSTADLDAKQLLEATRTLFREDEAFTGVFSAQVVKRGPVASQTVHVGVAGVDQLLPVTVDVIR